MEMGTQTQPTARRYHKPFTVYTIITVKYRSNDNRRSLYSCIPNWG